MFFRLTPFAIAASDHPLFRLEARGVTNYHNFSSLRYHSVSRIGLTIAGCIILFAVYLLLKNTGGSYSYAYSAQQALLANAADFTLLLIIVGILANAYIDFVSLGASMTAINGEVVSGRWDLLRLSGMREGYFTVSKHGIAQLKAWRSVMNVVGMRLAAGVSGLLLGLSVLAPEFSLGVSTLNDTLIAVSSLLALIVFAIVFALEPIWRMRTITAVGLYVSTRTRNPSYSPLLGFALVFLIWVAQFFIFSALGMAVGMLFFPMFFFLTDITVIFLPLIALLVAAAVYGFYLIIQQWCLRRVARSLVALER